MSKNLIPVLCIGFFSVKEQWETYYKTEIDELMGQMGIYDHQFLGYNMGVQLELACEEDSVSLISFSNGEKKIIESICFDEFRDDEGTGDNYYFSMFKDKDDEDDHFGGLIVVACTRKNVDL